MNLPERAKRAPITPDSTIEVAKPTACPVSGSPACKCVHTAGWNVQENKSADACAKGVLVHLTMHALTY
jgi:hypothetical protein